MAAYLDVSFCHLLFRGGETPACPDKNAKTYPIRRRTALRAHVRGCRLGGRGETPAKQVNSEGCPICDCGSQSPRSSGCVMLDNK